MPETTAFIPRSVFLEYEAFRQAGTENALMFFVRNPQHERWGPWIITGTNYKDAKQRYSGS